MQIKLFFACFFSLLLSSGELAAQSVVIEDVQRAILAEMPPGVTAATASHDDIARAAIEVVFAAEGEFETSVTNTTMALGRLEQSGVFASASGPGRQSPTLFFYNSMINLTSSGARDTTPQYIIRASDAMVEALNRLNQVDEFRPEQ